MTLFIFTNGIKKIEIYASNSIVAWEIFETKYGGDIGWYLKE